MDVVLRHQEGLFIATDPDHPGAQGVGEDLDEALGRLHRVLHAAHRPVSPCSPFATVRKRLAEPGRGISGR